MKNIEVVAAVICKDGKIFATQRGYGEWKDWWEFPGGKVEPEETHTDALKLKSVRNLTQRLRLATFSLQWSMTIPIFI